MFEAFRKLLLAIITQTPLVGGLYMKWDKVLQHPVASAVIGLSYELVVVFASFGKKGYSVADF